MPIRALPSHLVNQIAAGEVVERPASVAKELIENSLDAGASRIEVELEAGGVRLCRVRDDGLGIPRDELALAVGRHATSKIATLDDLEQVATLGFRGEALPSIGSVARLTLESRARGSGSAFRIQVEDGGLTGPEPVAHPDGTTVTVRDLFYNTPARRRFLRSERTEFQRVREVVERCALAREAVAFRLVHNGRTLLDLPAARDPVAVTRRIESLCGEEFVAGALQVERGSAALSLRGWLSRPTTARPQPDLQHLVLNGRVIRDRGVAAAVRAAYRDVLYRDRYPAFVLHLDMDPALVDVNAHPAKHEVRFREPGAVFDFVRRTVETALASGPAPGTDTPGATAPPGSDAEVVRAAGGRVASASRRPVSFRTGLPARPVAVGEAAAPGYLAPGPRDFGTALAHLHGIYVLAATPTGLILVDAHAAHERITYERLKRSLQAGNIATQGLLLPVNVGVAEADADAVEAHGLELARLGYGLRRSGPGKVLITGVPALLADADHADLLHALLPALRNGRPDDDLWGVLERSLANTACRSSIHARRMLEKAEMDRLLKDMAETPRIDQCNHGRPTWVAFSLSELDRFFARGR